MRPATRAITGWGGGGYKIGFDKIETAKRIETMRVEAGRDDDRIRAKRIAARQEPRSIDLTAARPAYLGGKQE